jgi:hypothetical protein
VVAVIVGRLLTRVVRGWERFWFEPVATSTLAFVRIGFGITVFCFTLSLAPDLLDFFAREGIMPETPHFPGMFGVLDLWGSDTAIVVLWVLLLIASACVTVGYHTRLAAVIVYVAVVSFERRNPYLFNSGDALVRLLALYVMLAPAGVPLSLDRWRRAKARFWEFPARAPWALRLIQVQLSVIYISTVWAKIMGTSWNAGTAASYAMRIEDLARFPVPTFISDNLLIANLVTYATLAIELAIGVLVWNRRARPWVLGFGVLLHVSIDLTLTVAFFSWAVFVCYLSFIPEDTAARWLIAVRRRLERSRLPVLRTVAVAGGGSEPAPVAAVVPTGEALTH